LTSSIYDNFIFVKLLQDFEFSQHCR